MAEQSEHISVLSVTNRTLKLEFDAEMKSRISCSRNGSEKALGGFSASQSVRTESGELETFRIRSTGQEKIHDEMGDGIGYRITGAANGIEKTVRICSYAEFASTLFVEASFTNIGEKKVRVAGWTANRCAVCSSAEPGQPCFWSFQGASYESRPDWVLPLKNGYSRQNFMGMNSSDYGGGIPLTDIWDGTVGLAMGHCETLPELISLPVEVNGITAVLSVTGETDVELAPGETLHTVKTFLSLHEGDYFSALLEFRKIMSRRGFAFAPLNREAYEATWCAWGYERNFAPEQIEGALPKVKELGFKWICLDDGWQTEEGDWELDRSKFPAGDEDMRKFVRKIHEQGMKIQLWWMPMACDPKSKLFAEHPEAVISDSAGNPCSITWWDNYYLCPADAAVVGQTRKMVRKILGDWGFDGLKIDGQYLNAAPLCHNKAHGHESPEDSYKAVPGFFRMIYEEAKRINPDALIMFCPCGTCCSFYTLPYFDMPVASDPESSRQVRQRCKAYKALLGRNVPYNADHIELSDGGSDFASAVGTGSVINTKFTWPVGSGPAASISDPGECFDLDEQKEALFRKWLGIYRDKMLPEGEYLGELYTYGYDIPECHAIRKDGGMYYAFYADSFDGTVELRGLGTGSFLITDYVSGKTVGRLEPGTRTLRIRFEKSALLEARRLGKVEPVL